LEPFESFDEILGKGRGGLDLSRREHPFFSQEQIDSKIPAKSPRKICWTETCSSCCHCAFRIYFSNHSSESAAGRSLYLQSTQRGAVTD
jgi:hypothetical protein